MSDARIQDTERAAASKQQADAGEKVQSKLNLGALSSSDAGAQFESANKNLEGSSGKSSAAHRQVESGLHHGKQGTVTLPLMFVTDRQWSDKKDEYANKRNTDSHRPQDLDYGIAHVSVPVKDPVPENCAEMGWAKSTKQSGQAKLDEVERQNYQTFMKELPAFANATKDKDIVVFVHGFNTKFHQAAEGAGTLSEVLGKPVVFYTWPTGGKTSYRATENNCEWSSQHFGVFLNQLKKQIGAEHISIVSHSMGNRLVKWAVHDDAVLARGERIGRDKALNALADQDAFAKAEISDSKETESQSKDSALKEAKSMDNKPEDTQPISAMLPIENETPKYKQLDLVSPDVDRGAFKNDWWAVAAATDSARLYISHKDHIIKFSGLINGHPRAGDQDNPKDHWDYPAPIQGTQTIDFSLVDKPIFPKFSLLPISLGHHIPFELIKNMKETGQPGQGLETTKLVNGKSSFFKVQKMPHDSHPA